MRKALAPLLFDDDHGAAVRARRESVVEPPSVKSGFAQSLQTGNLARNPRSQLPSLAFPS